ncbi:hypothetical protein C4F17_12405 [Variovorax sp. PMC12]|nr:hypothetical protein C4F17_12405 [Variovorax sp. PMC12]
MRAMAALIFAACAAFGAHAQDCQRATRNYEVSRNSLRPDQGMVDRAWQEMQAACGAAPAAQRYEPAQPVHRGPGQFVNCDQAGCWGAQNGVRYNFVAGGNLQGTDGTFCARGAGNTFSCN